MSNTASLVDLNEVANQTRFAALVGVDQSMIAKHLAKGKMTRNATMGVWLVEYCENLRQQATGRGGSAQERLTIARIEESAENTASKRQARLMQSGALIDKEQVAQFVKESAGEIKTGVLTAGETIIERIQSKYDIELDDDDDVLGELKSALGHAGSVAQQFARNVGAVGDGVEAQTAGTDSTMG